MVSYLDHAADGDGDRATYRRVSLIAGLIWGISSLALVKIVIWGTVEVARSSDPEGLLQAIAATEHAPWPWLGFLAALIGFIPLAVLLPIMIEKFHHRSWRTSVTPFLTIDGKQILRGVAWFGVLYLAVTAVVALALRDSVTVRFELGQFLPGLLILLALVWVQAFGQELLFRGYNLQWAWLDTKVPAVLATISGLTFAVPFLFAPWIVRMGRARGAGSGCLVAGADHPDGRVRRRGRHLGVGQHPHRDHRTGHRWSLRLQLPDRARAGSPGGSTGRGQPVRDRLRGGAVAAVCRGTHSRLRAVRAPVPAVRPRSGHPSPAERCLDGHSIGPAGGQPDLAGLGAQPAGAPGPPGPDAGHHRAQRHVHHRDDGVRRHHQPRFGPVLRHRTRGRRRASRGPGHRFRRRRTPTRADVRRVGGPSGRGHARSRGGVAVREPGRGPDPGPGVGGTRRWREFRSHRGVVGRRATARGNRRPGRRTAARAGTGRVGQHDS